MPRMTICVSQKLCLLLVVLSLGSACTSMQSVTDRYEYKRQPGQVIVDEIKPGEPIKVVTTAGDTHELEVTVVTYDQIIGKSCPTCPEITVPVSEITELYSKEVSVVKTAGMGTAVFVGVVVVLVAVFLIGGGGSVGLPSGP